MSLIDEALRRAQSAYRENAARPGSAPDPWSVAPLPDRGRFRRRRLLVASALAAILLAGIATGFLLLRRDRSAAASRSAQAAAAGGQPDRSGFSARLTPTPPPRPPAAHAAPVPPPVRTQAAAAISRRAVPGTAVGAAAPVLSMRAASSSPATVRRPAPLPVRAERDHASSPRAGPERRTISRGEAAVPGGKIELGGIVYSDTSPVAVLNGRVLGVGAVVEGFTIVAIEENRVELKNDERTIVLTLH